MNTPDAPQVSLSDVEAQTQRLREVMSAYLESSDRELADLGGVGVALRALSKQALPDGVPAEAYSWADAAHDTALTTTMTLGEASAFMREFQAAFQERAGSAAALPRPFDLYPALRNTLEWPEPSDERRKDAAQRGAALGAVLALAVRSQASQQQGRTS